MVLYDKPDYKLNYIIGHMITKKNQRDLDDILNSEVVLYSKGSGGKKEALMEMILAAQQSEAFTKELLNEQEVTDLEKMAREAGASDEQIKVATDLGQGGYNLININENTPKEDLITLIVAAAQKDSKVSAEELRSLTVKELRRRAVAAGVSEAAIELACAYMGFKNSLSEYYLTELSIEYVDATENYKLRFESKSFREYEARIRDGKIPNDINTLWGYNPLYEKKDQTNATIKLMSEGDISKLSTIKDKGLSIKRLIEEAITPELIPCVVTTTDQNRYFTFLDKSEIKLVNNKYNIIDKLPCIFFNAAIQYLKPIVIENNDYLLEINGEDFVLKRYDKLYRKTYQTESEYFDSSEHLRNFLNEMIHECKKKKRKNDTRELEHICYLNKEEDVRMWNHQHHSDLVMIQIVYYPTSFLFSGLQNKKCFVC